MPNNPTNTSSSPLLDPVPPSAGKLLYQADWSNDSNNWNTVGQWKYDRKKKMLMSDGSQANFVILAPYKLQSANYAIEAKIQFESETSSSNDLLSVSSFGIAFNIGNSSQGYVCDIARFFGASISSIGDDGIAHSITDSTSYRPGTSFHTYRIEVRGNTISSFIDGQEFVQTTTDNSSPPLQAGLLGIRAKSVILYVKSFKVFAL